MDRFARHFMRGLATVLPPLLTIVILIWIWTTLVAYVLFPIRTGLTKVIAKAAADIKRPGDSPANREAKSGERTLDVDGIEYVYTGQGEYIPRSVYNTVAADAEDGVLPTTAQAFWRSYIAAHWLRPIWFYPASLLAVLAMLYLIGRLTGPDINRMVLSPFHRLMHHVPIVRRVYDVVQQATSHLIATRPFEFQRVVAVEYPRRGVWCIGYVVNEGMHQIAMVAQEPVLTVFFDTWPVPLTGYTIMVRRSEAITLGVTLDEAIQYIVSGGIIVPTQQQAARDVIEPPTV